MIDLHRPIRRVLRMPGAQGPGVRRQTVLDHSTADESYGAATVVGWTGNRDFRALSQPFIVARASSPCSRASRKRNVPFPRLRNINIANTGWTPVPPRRSRPWPDHRIFGFLNIAIDVRIGRRRTFDIDFITLKFAWLADTTFFSLMIAQGT